MLYLTKPYSTLKLGREVDERAYATPGQVSPEMIPQTGFLPLRPITYYVYIYNSNATSSIKFALFWQGINKQSFQ